MAEAVSVLNAAQEKLDYAKEIIDGVHDEEEDAMDALPDGIRDGDRGDAMQENIDELENISYEIEMMSDSVQEQIDAVQEVIER